MSTFAPQFGSYVYANETGVYVQRISDDMDVRTRMAETPGRAGNYTAGGLLAMRRVQMSGIIAVPFGTDLRDTWEAFKAAHRPGVIQALYAHTDRYLLAEVSGVGKAEYDSLAYRQLQFDVDFACSDPYWYDVDTTTTTGLAGGGTVTAGGTAPGAPLWTLVVSSIGTAGTITITNTTTGEAFVLTPAATGTYLIDALAETVVRSSVDVSEQSAGVIPTLAVGANTITVDLTGSATLTSLTCAAQDRYF